MVIWIQTFKGCSIKKQFPFFLWFISSSWRNNINMNKIMNTGHFGAGWLLKSNHFTGDVTIWFLTKHLICWVSWAVLLYSRMLFEELRIWFTTFSKNYCKFQSLIYNFLHDPVQISQSLIHNILHYANFRADLQHSPRTVANFRVWFTTFSKWMQILWSNL